MKPWVSYSLLRLAIFAGTFAVLMLLGQHWLLSAAVAAVVGLCVSYIFFGKLRRQVALDLQTRRHGPVADADTRAEDEAEDAHDLAEAKQRPSVEPEGPTGRS